MGKKLVAQPLALRGAGHQTRDVDEFHGGGENAFGMHDLRQLLQARIRHRHNAHIRVYGAEWIILGRDLGARESVE